MKSSFASSTSHVNNVIEFLFASVQVGVTPSHTERPRDNSAVVATYTLENKPLTADSAGKSDPKWRFFWRIGPRPLSTDFPELNAPPVIPAAFRDEWAETLNPWGTRLLDAVMTVAEMLALGLGLPQNAISDKLQYGPHLLAPTGSDMSLLSQRVGTTIAGFHYDINALTIHGKSRYPGLFVWTRSGMRIPVHVPDGCLLVQAGIQIEHLTSGLIKRGMHEVVVSEETRSAAQAALREGRCTWRVSSTLFAHVRSDEPLDPLGQFGEPRGLRAGDQIAAELRALNLAK